MVSGILTICLNHSYWINIYLTTLYIFITHLFKIYWLRALLQYDKVYYKLIYEYTNNSKLKKKKKNFDLDLQFKYAKFKYKFITVSHYNIDWATLNFILIGTHLIKRFRISVINRLQLKPD